MKKSSGKSKAVKEEGGSSHKTKRAAGDGDDDVEMDDIEKKEKTRKTKKKKRSKDADEEMEEVKIEEKIEVKREPKGKDVIKVEKMRKVGSRSSIRLKKASSSLSVATAGE